MCGGTPRAASNHRWTVGVSWVFVGLWLNRLIKSQKSCSATTHNSSPADFERATAAACVYTFSIPVQLLAQQR